MFAGYAVLDDDFTTYFLTQDENDLPVSADSPPTWDVYGADGPMTAGSGTATSVMMGFYRLLVPVTGTNGYDLGQTYTILIRYTIDDVGRATEQKFTVT
jgi:hypothetical protein